MIQAHWVFRIALAAALAAAAYSQNRTPVTIEGKVTDETIRVRGGGFTVHTPQGSDYYFTTFQISDAVFDQLNGVQVGTWVRVSGQVTEVKGTLFPVRVTKLAGPPPSAGSAEPQTKGAAPAADLAAVKQKFAEFKSVVQEGNVRAIVAMFAAGVKLSTIGCRCDTVDGDPVDFAETLIRMDRESKESFKSACIADGFIREVNFSNANLPVVFVTMPGNNLPNCAFLELKKASGRWMIATVHWAF